MVHKRTTLFVRVLLAAMLSLGLVACRGTAETTNPGADGDAALEPADGGVANDAADAAAAPDQAGGLADVRTDAESPLDAGSGDVGDDADAAIDTPNVSAGCATGAGLQGGEHTFMLDGLSRRFILRLPQNYTRDRAWPVVLALHGNGGSTSYWDQTSGERNIRGVLANDAILVVAEAIDGNWRDYNADPGTWPGRIEMELAYFEEILTRLRADLCVAEDSIFSMGFSGGGSFSGVLGCRRTDIRAIAVGGSVIYFDPANCVGTPAAWITIGTEELTGGREDYRDFFRDRASCDATSTATEPAPCVAYDNCDAQTPVHYCQHPAGHIWPDFGSEAMWSFFSQFVEPQ